MKLQDRQERRFGAGAVGDRASVGQPHRRNGLASELSERQRSLRRQAIA